jgi:coiled-coil domain-containing protein 40
LKELEMESVQMKEKIERVKEERERLLNELVETERHIMLWERKIQLAQETQSAVDSDIGQGEIKAMKSEIHRMEVRYTQLMRQQELLIQDMEKSVSRRDTIMTRGEAENKLKQKAVTRGSLQRDITEMKKKIRDVIQDANEADKDLSQSSNSIKMLRQDIAEREEVLRKIQEEVDTLKVQLSDVADSKRLNLLQIRRRQEMARHYNNIKDGKYNRYCRGQTNREMERLYNRLQSLGLVIDQLMEENPQLSSSLQTFRAAVDGYLADFESGH